MRLRRPHEPDPSGVHGRLQHARRYTEQWAPKHLGADVINTSTCLRTVLGTCWGSVSRVSSSSHGTTLHLLPTSRRHGGSRAYEQYLMQASRTSSRRSLRVHGLDRPHPQGLHRIARTSCASQAGNAVTQSGDGGSSGGGGRNDGGKGPGEPGGNGGDDDYIGEGEVRAYDVDFVITCVCTCIRMSKWLTPRLGSSWPLVRAMHLIFDRRVAPTQ